MAYFRTGFASFEEFQREGNFSSELGKDELELLRDLEADEEFDRPRRYRDEWE